MEKKLISTSVTISEDDAYMLDQMLTEDILISRSSFFRKLIRQEWERRHQPVRLVSDAVGVDQDVNSLSE